MPPNSPYLGAAHSLFWEAIGGASIPTWSDAPNRTKAEVLAAFDRAIALAGNS